MQKKNKIPRDGGIAAMLLIVSSLVILLMPGLSNAEKMKASPSGICCSSEVKVIENKNVEEKVGNTIPAEPGNDTNINGTVILSV